MTSRSTTQYLPLLLVFVAYKLMRLDVSKDDIIKLLREKEFQTSSVSEVTQL